MTSQFQEIHWTTTDTTPIRNPATTETQDHRPSHRQNKGTKMAEVHLSRPSLTTNDSAVLQALFDAESSPSGAVTVDVSLPPLPTHLNISLEDYETLKSREIFIVKTLQPDSVAQEIVESAIKDFDTIIAEYPTYPSAYANRAQALRMLVDMNSSDDTHDTTTSPSLINHNHTETVSRLFADLGQAISLATPRSPADPVSAAQARILADSHTHRGYLLLKAAKEKKSALEASDREVDISNGPDKLRAMDPDQLEEMASRDFFYGGRYGNQVAQQLAVQTNPYAKMCGAIVKEAMRKELEV
ncbi:hypothetical protein FE257_008440 [Aspergillus nanangensis]|uniref:Uncharacterized protein n=1 Tax=Aspergillus nanangensis TaxID=2582783 RepID=A0AAD4CLS9_ASPNN|nr:hypothetical protein FE257_008440 [Aspergillus nanangensis]